MAWSMHACVHAGIVASSPQRRGRCVSLVLHVPYKTVAGHSTVLVEAWDDREPKTNSSLIGR